MSNMIRVVSQKTFVDDDGISDAQEWACKQYLKNPEVIPVIVALEIEITYDGSYEKDAEPMIWPSQKTKNTVVFGSDVVPKKDIEDFMSSFLKSEACTLTDRMLEVFHQNVTDLNDAGLLMFVCHHVVLLEKIR